MEAWVSRADVPAHHWKDNTRQAASDCVQGALSPNGQRSGEHTHRGIIQPREGGPSPGTVTTWMDPEDMMPSEISQTRTQTVRPHLCVESKTKAKITETEQNCGYQVLGRRGEADYRVQTPVTR